MNKRIKELAIQAGAQPVNLPQYVTLDWQKFAELVVQDCIELVDGYTKGRTLTTHYDAVEQIKHHFGVEG